MNILIASCGTRNKVVQYFRQAIGDDGWVTATDMSPYAPALYEADAWYNVPRITDENYIPLLKQICVKEHVDGILSLIDPELALLAEHEKEFAEIGVKVIGSSKELCDLSLDKWAMYGWLKEHGYHTQKTWKDFDEFLKAVKDREVSYPVFVKPAHGSASLHISKARNEEEARFLYTRDEDMIIQEYMTGTEVGVDVYIDMISGEVVSIFTKKKLVMRAGETDKAVSFRDNELFELVERFVKEAGYRGQIDIDIFITDEGYAISEVNPRFGGGYPHAQVCGLDHPAMIMKNLAGEINERKIGRYPDDVVMMKFCDILTCPAKD